tara:strand:+ start:316 stop:729 length:414 start_codon:yes stop_codon:yes gene_type:complete
MAHFAKVENGIVTDVIVAEQDFIDSLANASEWIQTSYNTHGGIHYAPNSKTPDDGVALRKNFASNGYTYDLNRDAFIPPKFYDSWIFNESTCLWDPPIPYPDDDNMYQWDEDNIEWTEWIPEGHTWNEETQTWDLVD